MSDMHRTLTLALALSATVVAIALPAAAEPPLLGLAAQLRDLGRPEACAVEALRHWHTSRESHAQALQLATACLIAAERAPAALRLLQQPEVASEVAADAALSTRHCLLAAVVAPAHPLPAQCTEVDAADPVRLPAVAVPAMRALALQDWTLAEVALAREPTAAALAPWQAQSRAWIQQAAALQHPSPWLAAGLSAVVPGLGKVYLGRWQDGLASLVLVGAPAVVAGYKFERNGVASLGGWLLGAIAAMLYAGNVAGSYVAAENRAIEGAAQLRAEVGRGLLQRLAP